MRYIKRIGVTLLITLILILGLLWWLPAPVIKWAIETFGSQAVGAKVEVDSVDFKWYPTHLAINNLAVTNPRNPMFNALVIQQASTDIQLMPIFNGQYYFDQINIYGIALDTKRQKSGALAQSDAQNVSDQPSKPFVMPDLGIPSPTEMIEREKQIYQEKIATFKSKLEARKVKWQEIVDELPGDERLDELENEWDEVKKGNVLEKLAKAKKLRDKVKEDYKNLKSSEQQIRAEYGQLKDEYDALKAMSGQSTREIVAQLGLSDSALANLSADLLDGVVQQWIAKGLGYYDILAPSSSTDAADEQSEQLSQQPKTAPTLLVKLVNVTGPFQWQGKAGEIEGKLTHFSDAPRLYDQPMGLNLRAQGELIGSLDLVGKFDHRQTPASDQLSLNAQNVVLTALPMVNSDSLSLSLQKPTLNMDARAQVVSGSQLLATFDSELSRYSVSVGGQEAQTTWAKSLEQALSNSQSLTLKGKLAGSMNNPDLSLRSNFESVLKQAFKSGVEDKVNALKQDVRHELGKALEQELTGLEQPMAGVEGLYKQLGLQSKAYEDFSGAVK